MMKATTVSQFNDRKWQKVKMCGMYLEEETEIKPEDMAISG